MNSIEIRKILGISRAEFSRRYHIPPRTLEDWDKGVSKPPAYVLELLERVVREDAEPRPHAKWIWYEVNGVDYCKCDKCHNGAWEMEFDFCSYCGADMRESEGE